jgi:hypothetical protein
MVVGPLPSKRWSLILYPLSVGVHSEGFFFKFFCKRKEEGMWKEEKTGAIMQWKLINSERLSRISMVISHVDSRYIDRMH